MNEDTSLKLDIQLMDRRLARMESRIVRLMLHLGLDPHEISLRPERKEDDTCKTSTHSTLAKRSN